MRRWKWLGLVAVIVVFAVAGLWAGSRALDRHLDPFDDQPFDATAWATADEQGRGPMARDAIRRLPPGTPAARVRELLGEPKPIAYVAKLTGAVDVYGNKLEHPTVWAYYLGSWSGLGRYNFDDAFLYVHFDTEDRVVVAEVTGG